MVEEVAQLVTVGGRGGRAATVTRPLPSVVEEVAQLITVGARGGRAATVTRPPGHARGAPEQVQGGRAGALVSRLAALAPQPAADARPRWSRRSRSDRHETPGHARRAPEQVQGGRAGALVSRLAALAPQPAADARRRWSRRSRSDRHETPGTRPGRARAGPGRTCGRLGFEARCARTSTSGGRALSRWSRRSRSDRHETPFPVVEEVAQRPSRDPSPGGRGALAPQSAAASGQRRRPRPPAGWGVNDSRSAPAKPGRTCMGRAWVRSRSPHRGARGRYLRSRPPPWRGTRSSSR